MKKLTTIFTMMLMLIGMSVQAQTWNFTTSTANDIEKIEADVTNWIHVTADKKDYYGLITAITNAALKAGDTELDYAKGLLLTCSSNNEGNIRLDIYHKCMWVAGSTKIIIPSVEEGKIVTIEAQSSSSSEARGYKLPTNVENTSGNFGKTSKDKVTYTGKVTKAGNIELQATGSMYVYSIKVADEDEAGGGDSGSDTPSANDYSVASNMAKNQAILTLKDNSRKYYNTNDVTSIDIEGSNVTIKQSIGEYTFTDNVADISFRKAEQGGDIENTDGVVQITKAGGWLESAYIEFADFANAENYNVYVKGGQYSDYTKIDGQLIRSYGTYNRADALGLKAGTYSIKVVPVIDDEEFSSAANEATNITVKNFNRDGYAHHNATEGIGAYNNDGTLKDGARVIYVSKANAKTIQLSMIVGNNNKEEARTGIQDIIQAYERGEETRPLAIRIIGQLKKADMPTLGSSAIGLQVKGKNQNMNLTIEGVGNDATFHGFGVLLRNCRYVELRNFAVMMHPEDGISFDTNNEHLWGHHLDIFYGENKGGDKEKGDGSFDVKGTLYCTVSDNHFWDAGKCNLNSNGDEVDFVTYHHNWYDHSDSRHPRVRKSKHLHVFNNYFDGNAKYGVGATTGSCIFVEKNYYRNCKYPMLISKQGSDVHNGVGSSSDTKGTFSGEDGGIIKAFDNYMTGQTSFEPYIAGDATYSKHFDAYVVDNRKDKVPAEVVTLQGGTGYNNFDTANDFYNYTPDAKEDVPAIVTGAYGAGRCEKGDFEWTFDNATEDKNSDVINDLSNALKNYTGKLVKVYGDMGAESGEQGGDSGEGDNQGGDDPEIEIPEGTIVCSFNNSVSNSMFKIGEKSTYGDANVTYNGSTYKRGLKLNSDGYIEFTPAKNYNMKIVLSTAKSGRDVKLNNTTTTVNGIENTEGKYYELAPIAVAKDTEYTIKKGSSEANVALIILEPIE